MELTIKGTPKEIADLVIAIQGQQKQSEGKHQSEIPEKPSKPQNWY